MPKVFLIDVIAHYLFALANFGIVLTPILVSTIDFRTVRPLLLGSLVHHVLVPGSVADTHISSRLISKSYFYCYQGKHATRFGLHNLGHWPYFVYQSAKTAGSD
jgi:hypothetical protein